MARRMVYDRWLFITAALLVLGGLLMVGSSSAYEGLNKGNASLYLLKQGFYALLGLAGFAVALRVPYRKLAQRPVVLLILAGCLAALLLVLAMPPQSGARRWIPLGPLHFQPSEFAKLVVVLVMAYVLSRKQDRVNEAWSVPIPTFMVVGVLAFLVVIEPDLGSAVMIFSVSTTMIFVAGLAWRYIGLVAVLAASGFAASVVAEPYRLQRVKSFLEPSLDGLGSGFQLYQSLIALGSGGLFGVGLGQGQQKAGFVPEAHTDFIFAMIGEELGLLGTLTVVAAFVLILWRGLRAAVRAPEPFGFYLALGLTTLLVLQAFVNMGVCLGLLPTKGLALPFISYGGSSLLASMTAMGLLLNVSQHSN